MAIVVTFPDPLEEGVSGECRGEGADGRLQIEFQTIVVAYWASVCDKVN